jgi:hypothetical protein
MFHKHLLSIFHLPFSSYHVCAVGAVGVAVCVAGNIGIKGNYAVVTPQK